MFNAFDPKLIGNTVTMSTTFYDSGGTKIIPDTVTLSYKRPDYSLETVQVTASNSKYTQSVYLNQSGIWYFRWECSGVYASAEEFQITVKDTLVK